MPNEWPHDITNIKSLHRKSTSYPREGLKSFARRLAASDDQRAARDKSPGVARRWLANNLS